MWLGCLAIAVDHISMLQAVQKKKKINTPSLTYGQETVSSYTYNELQMTVLFLLSSVLQQNAFFQKIHHAEQYTNSQRESYLLCQCVSNNLTFWLHHHPVRKPPPPPRAKSRGPLSRQNTRVSLSDVRASPSSLTPSSWKATQAVPWHSPW